MTAVHLNAGLMGMVAGLYVALSIAIMAAPTTPVPSWAIWAWVATLPVFAFFVLTDPTYGSSTRFWGDLRVYRYPQDEGDEEP